MLTVVIPANKDATPKFYTGCFQGSLEQFEAAVTATHGFSRHAQEYQLAIAMVKSIRVLDDAERRSKGRAEGETPQMTTDRILNSSEIVYPPVGKHDPEDCEACSVVEEPCLYHEGFDAGFVLALRLIGEVAKDPDYAAEHYLRQPAKAQH